MILIRTSIGLIQIVTHLLTICEHYNNAEIKSLSSYHHPRPRLLLGVDVIGLLRAPVIWGPLKVSRRILNKSADCYIRPPHVILASTCEYEMLFSICPGLHSPFNFPTGLQLLFTQIAVQLISSHTVKILWVTKLKYLWIIGRRLLDTFANIQGAIISKGKYFSDKNSFSLSFR